MNWDTKNRAYRLVENKHAKFSKLFKIDVLRAFLSTKIEIITDYIFTALLFCFHFSLNDFDQKGWKRFDWNIHDF